MTPPEIERFIDRLLALCFLLLVCAPMLISCACEKGSPACAAAFPPASP